MAPQYIKQPRGTIHYDADVIQLSFEQKRVRHSVLSFVRHWGTKFTQKYATFLDGVFAIPTHFNTETFERRDPCTLTVVRHVLNLAAECMYTGTSGHTWAEESDLISEVSW